jgi:uncharacterized membrane protein YgcG
VRHRHTPAQVGIVLDVVDQERRVVQARHYRLDLGQHVRIPILRHAQPRIEAVYEGGPHVLAVDGRDVVIRLEEGFVHGVFVIVVGGCGGGGGGGHRSSSSWQGGGGGGGGGGSLLSNIFFVTLGHDCRLVGLDGERRRK